MSNSAVTGIALGSLCLDVTALVCGSWAAHPSVDWHEHDGAPITGWAIVHVPSDTYVSPDVVDGLDRDEAERILLALAEVDATPEDWIVIQIVYSTLHQTTQLTVYDVLASAIAPFFRGVPLLDAIAAAAGDDGDLAGWAVDRLARWIGVAPPELETWASWRSRDDVIAALRGASS